MLPSSTLRMSPTTRIITHDPQISPQQSPQTPKPPRDRHRSTTNLPPRTPNNQNPNHTQAPTHPSHHGNARDSSTAITIATSTNSGHHYHQHSGIQAPDGGCGRHLPGAKATANDMPYLQCSHADAKHQGPLQVPAPQPASAANGCAPNATRPNGA